MTRAIWGLTIEPGHLTTHFAKNPLAASKQYARRPLRYRIARLATWDRNLGNCNDARSQNIQHKSSCIHDPTFCSLMRLLEPSNSRQILSSGTESKVHPTLSLGSCISQYWQATQDEMVHYCWWLKACMHLHERTTKYRAFGAASAMQLQYHHGHQKPSRCPEVRKMDGLTHLPWHQKEE